MFLLRAYHNSARRRFTVLPVVLTFILVAPLFAKERKVLILGYDGIRSDAFQVAETPVMDALAQNGVVTYDAQTEDNTISGCCWSSILLGVHRDRHGVDGNVDYGAPMPTNNIGAWPDVFTRLESFDSSIVTARFTRWTEMSQTPTEADVNYMQRLPGGGYPNDLEVAADACLFLRGSHPFYSENPDVFFVYHGDTDKTGHTYGFSPDSPQYIASIEQDDMLTAQYLAALQSRPDYANEDWMIIIVTDHGGLGTSHGAATQETRTVPLIVSGDSIVRTDVIFPQRRTTDVTATVLAYMGVPEADFADLDGRPFGFSVDTLPQLALGTNLVFNGDAESMRGFDDATPDQYCSGWEDRDGDGMSVMRYAALSTQPTQSPAGRGDNFFIGGIIGESTMSQRIDLSEIGPLIASGRVAYDLSGWLGGWGNQDDHSDLLLRFLDDAGDEISQVLLQGPLAAERKNVTTFARREAEGTLPTGTRAVEVALRASRPGTSGDNDGFADNISLILSAIGKPGDLSGDLAVGSDDLDIVRANWGRSVVPGNLADGDANGDGTVGSADLDIVRAHWGEESTTAVPEPAAWWLLIWGLFAPLLRSARHVLP